MCVVSMVADHYRDKFSRDWPPPNLPFDQPWPNPPIRPPVTREEFDRLRADVDEMMALLRRAHEYDVRNNEPECEVDEKIELLRRIARMVGVDIDDAIPPKTTK